MKNDFKIFLKYIFNPRGFLEEILKEMKKLTDAKTFSAILIAGGIFALIKLPVPRNAYTCLFLWVLALIILLRNIYQGGEHRYWHRQRMKEKIKDGKYA